MSYEIVESLVNVGYDGRLIDENAFGEAISEGFKNEDFRSLIVWLTSEIAELGKLEEKITCLDISSFLIELSGFLKELQCTYDVLVGDMNINNRMPTVESRYILLEFLIGELMTQKMVRVKQKPKDKGSVITIHETPTAAALKDIAITLNLGKPPENISGEALFHKINNQYDETLRNIPKGEQRIGNPLFNPKNPLTNDQWVRVEKIQAALDEEYNMRRKMLMTRLDVTVQSFKWSEKIKGSEKDINEKFISKQQLLEKIVKGDNRTDVVALLAARDKLAIIEKTSSANVRKNTKSKLQRHIMGKVPDRGGRTLEHQKPPPEMPSWQKRNDAGSRGGGGGRGHFNQGRGGRGGFHQQQQQQQGFPQQQYQSRPQHKPSNHQGGGSSSDYQYYGNNQTNYDNQSGYSAGGGGGGFHRGGGGGGGGRVQGGWNNRGQSYDNNYRGGRGRGRH